VKYSRIMVTCRRGDRPPYSYEVYPKVRTNRSLDIIYRSAWEIMRHETSSQRRPQFSVEPTDDYTIVRVGICRFFVYAEELED